MSEAKLQEAQHHIVKSMTIIDHIVEILESRDDQEAGILLESLEILPQLKSNLSEAFEIINN